MLEIDRKGIYIGKHGELQTEDGIPTEGQKILNMADEILEGNPLKGVRYRGSDPGTESGPVTIIVPGKK